MNTQRILATSAALLALFAWTADAEASELPRPHEGRDLTLSLTGLGTATIELELDNGERHPLTLRNEDLVPAESHGRAFHSGPHFPDVLADGRILVSLAETAHWDSGVTRQYFVRPDPGHYPASEQSAVIAEWDALTPASARVFTVRISNDQGKLRFWVDGRYFTGVAFDAELAGVGLDLEGGAELVDAELVDPLDHGHHHVVELPHYARQGQASIADVSLEAGMQHVDGVPMHVAAPGEAVDVGVAKALRLRDSTRTDYYDLYHMRTPFDGVPETVMLRVAEGYYNHAYVLAAVEEHDEKAPVLSIRISRYFGGSPEHVKRGRGNAVAESQIRIVDDEGNPAEGVKRVGHVVMETEDGPNEVPLYLARVFVNLGEAIDLVHQTGIEDRHQGDPHEWGMTTDYLDIEFAGELMDWNPPSGNFGRRPLGKPSAVHMLGLTLASLPVEVKIASDEPGNHLYRHEDPALHVHTTNRGQATHEWTVDYAIRDYFGQTVQEDSRDVVLAPGEDEHTIDVSDLAEGWYELDLTLRDDTGARLWHETQTFVLLPPDTRRATPDDSPFGMWWNKYYHLSEGDLEIVGPIYQKLGMRHTIHSVMGHSFFGRNYTLDELGEYDMSVSQIRSLRAINRQRIRAEPLDEDVIRSEIEGLVDRFEGVKRALVYHEHRLETPEELEFPPELLGEAPQPLPTNIQARKEQFIENAILISRLYREIDPEIELYHGNSVRFGFHYIPYLRGGFPEEYLDVLSLEHTAGRSHLPEAQPHPERRSQGLWMLRELRDHYGYENARLSASYENLGSVSEGVRVTDGATGLHQQARHYVRNILHAMAYHVDVIHGGNVQDGGNAYYWTQWGPGGFNFRDLTPKPSFAAVATLTQVLDRAEFVRYLDTGSHTVYCLEFEQNDELVYVLWSVRGEREINLELGEADSYTQVNIVGQSTTDHAGDGALAIELSPDPVYLRTTAPIEVVGLGEPVHEAPAFADTRVLDPMDNADRWQRVERRDYHYENLDPGIPTRQGEFEVQTVSDAQAGAALEVTLIPREEISELSPQYLMLEPREPLVIDAPADRVGIEVKGNSSWGRVHWELKDANERTWKLTSDPMDGTKINFDGWRWIHTGLPDKTPSGNYGKYFADWSCFAGVYEEPWRELEYPVKVSRVIVELRDHVVYLTDLEPVRSHSIRLRNLSVIQD